jgi:hypothetical protein
MNSQHVNDGSLIAKSADFKTLSQQSSIFRYDEMAIFRYNQQTCSVGSSIILLTDDVAKSTFHLFTITCEVTPN